MKRVFIAGSRSNLLLVAVVILTYKVIETALAIAIVIVIVV